MMGIKNKLMLKHQKFVDNKLLFSEMLHEMK